MALRPIRTKHLGRPRRSSGLQFLTAPAAEVLDPGDFIVLDTFNRGNSVDTLGNAETGQAWVYPVPTRPFEVVSNEARPKVTAGAKYAFVNAGVANCTVEAKITGTVSSDGLTLRGDGTVQCVRLITSRVYKVTVAGGAVQNLGTGTQTFSQNIVGGDTVRAVMSGDTITIYRQAASSGPFVQIWTGGEAGFNTTATYFGLGSTNTTAGVGFDNFKVY